jgi:hypothetical protein
VNAGILRDGSVIGQPLAIDIDGRSVSPVPANVSKGALNFVDYGRATPEPSQQPFEVQTPGLTNQRKMNALSRALRW